MVGIPDIQGGGQILALLRGTAELSIDLLEAPAEVHSAMREIDDTWLVYWQRCRDLILRHQDGHMDWVGVWSEQPMVTVECDYACMISSDMFNEFFLPSVKRQTEWVDRTIFHLDGPGAVRHLEALLELETLDGVQWVPGAGAKPVSEWMPLLHQIQKAGKRLVARVQPAEVEPLLAALEPRGLLLQTGTATDSDAMELVERIQRYLH